MNVMNFGKGITVEDLRVFLDYWPEFVAEMDEANKTVVEKKENFFGEKPEFFAWCHLYELPIKQHQAIVTAGIVQGYSKILQVDDLNGWYKELTDAPNQIGVVPEIADKIWAYFDAKEPPDKEDINAVLPSVAHAFGLGLSMYNTLLCVLYHGCFLNELIDRVRGGDEKALFDAVRIDPSVVGCLSVSNRISKAVLLRDNRFFAKLKASINGKLAKREQANFQKMRLVFEILHEAGATRLTDTQLHELFVEELKLYSANAKGGGNHKALRKFADTYMKKNATT